MTTQTLPPSWRAAASASATEKQGTPRGVATPNLRKNFLALILVNIHVLFELRTTISPRSNVLASSLVSAYTVSICGVGVSVRLASSTTEPSSASTSSARRRLDILQHRSLMVAHFLRTRDAFFERDPEFDAELAGDALRLAHHRGRNGAAGRILADSGKVARDNALIGLKDRLPHNFSQISARISLKMGACIPP